MNNDFCHSLVDLTMIFTRDVVTRQNSTPNRLTRDRKIDIHGTVYIPYLFIDCKAISTLSLGSMFHVAAVAVKIRDADGVLPDWRHGPLTRYAMMRVVHVLGMSGKFSPPPRVSDPDTHHGTCVARVPWCSPGSLTSGFLWSRWRGKRS